MDVALVTGGFDPIHSGHLEYFKEAHKIGRLVVAVNSDEWLARKKGRAFMPLSERVEILRNIKNVSDVIVFDDSDDTACEAIAMTLRMYHGATVHFVNGGDRTENNIPEMECDVIEQWHDVEYHFGIGGSNKKNSSSWILKEWKAPKTKRDWGYYRVIHEVEGTKVKELTVEPGQKLSMQKHAKRNEYWLVTEGACEVLSQTDSGYQMPAIRLKKHDEYTIICGDWHQLYNPHNVPCRIVEIQYGQQCIEEDITRIEK